MIVKKEGITLYFPFIRLKKSAKIFILKKFAKTAFVTENSVSECIQKLVDTNNIVEVKETVYITT